MVSTAQSKGKKRSRSKRVPVGSRWVTGLIFIVSLICVPIALWGAGVLALSGPTALAILYPYVVLVRVESAIIPAVIANPLAQWLMYLQFPIYGIIMARVHRYRGIWIALNAVIWVHVLAWILALILVHVINPYLGF